MATVARSRCAYASSQGARARGSYGWVMNERSTRLRTSVTEASSPIASACTARFPISAASTGPATTGNPVASAVHWQSRRLSAPPPTRGIAGGGGGRRRRRARDGLDQVDRLSVLEREALEHAAGDRRLLDRRRLACACAV